MRHLTVGVVATVLAVTGGVSGHAETFHVPLEVNLDPANIGGTPGSWQTWQHQPSITPFTLVVGDVVELDVTFADSELLRLLETGEPGETESWNQSLFGSGPTNVYWTSEIEFTGVTKSLLINPFPLGNYAADMSLVADARSRNMTDTSCAFNDYHVTYTVTKLDPDGTPLTVNSVWLWFGADTIQIVPEPSTLALLSMGALVLVPYAWRRRRGR